MIAKGFWSKWDCLFQRDSVLVKGKIIGIMARKAMIVKAQKEPKFKVRKYNRCHLCGRPRAFLRQFNMCRICFRKNASEGNIPGVTKSSW